MRVYADTSFLVKLLSGEAGGSEAAAEYRRLNRPRLLYLPLHALEVENAIRQRAFHARRVQPSGERTEIRRERDAALNRVAQYLKRGALNDVLLDMDSAMDRARQLSAKHTDRLGVRAIDLLHVACALLVETEVFLTFDERQFALAKAEGMEAPLLRVTD
jgi:predicted nucleic acid-binding protein